MPTLLPELWVLVFSMLYQPPPPFWLPACWSDYTKDSLVAVSTTCKLFCRLVSPILYRCVVGIDLRCVFDGLATHHRNPEQGLFPSKLDTNFSKILQHGNWALVGPTDHRTLDRSAQEGYIRDLVYTLYEPRPSLPGVERVVLGHRFDCQWRGVEQHTLLMQAMSAWLSSVPMKMVCTHSANSPLLFHGLYLAAPTVTRHFHKYDIVPAVVPGALNSWISSPGTQHQRWIQRVAKEIERAQLLSRADNLPPLTKDTRIHLFGGGMGPSSGRFPESADLDRLVNTEEAGVIQIVKGERARLRAEEDQWNNLMDAEAKTAVQWAGTLSHKRWQDALCICCGWNSDEYLHESV